MQNLENYLWLALAWIAYFALHSFMASVTVKQFLKKYSVSLNKQSVLYNILAVVGLLALLIYNGALGGMSLLPKQGSIKILALFFGGGGVLVINAAFKQYTMKSFLGISLEQSELKKSGILAYIRHPIYAGTILISLGFLLYDPRIATIVSTACIYGYLIIGITLEERKLVNDFGQKYIEYKNEVPSLIPDLLKLLKKIT